jgi:hypothetical protein
VGGADAEVAASLILLSFFLFIFDSSAILHGRQVVEAFRFF